MVSTHLTPLTIPEPHPGSPPLMEVDAPTDSGNWVARNREALRAAVATRGSVLIRGVQLRDTSDVAPLLDDLHATPVTEREAFAPRQQHAAGVYSASKWPANEPMCMHHEQSYALEFPGLLLFACLTAPDEGGSTGLADATAVLNALPAELTERFDREGWLLTRTYNDEFGASPAEVFGTDDRSAIERYCRANAIQFAWQDDGALRTRQRRSAVITHPFGGQRCWFNQIAFLNEWTINPDVRDYLLDEYGRDGLPFNTLHGNGDPLSQDTVRQLNDTYAAQTTSRQWQDGDLLLVDNIRTAHSREPFSGPREIVVAMGDPVHLTDCAPSIEVSHI
jgi:alpha-ketoglutarate-dependent taurine dioxygenase